MATRGGEADDGHRVTVVDGRFTWAECTCGWRTPARRDRRSTRNAAVEHATTLGDGTTTTVIAPDPPRSTQ